MIKLFNGHSVVKWWSDSSQTIAKQLSMIIM